MKQSDKEIALTTLNKLHNELRQYKYTEEQPLTYLNVNLEYKFFFKKESFPLGAVTNNVFNPMMPFVVVNGETFPLSTVVEGFLSTLKMKEMNK